MTAKELRDKLAAVPDDKLVVIADADTCWILNVLEAKMVDDHFTLGGDYGDVVEC